MSIFTWLCNTAIRPTASSCRGRVLVFVFGLLLTIPSASAQGQSAPSATPQWKLHYEAAKKRFKAKELARISHQGKEFRPCLPG